MYSIKSVLPAASALGSKSLSHVLAQALTQTLQTYLSNISRQQQSNKKRKHRNKKKTTTFQHGDSIHICHKLWSHVWSDAISPRKIVPLAQFLDFFCIFSHCSTLYICSQNSDLVIVYFSLLSLAVDQLMLLGKY